MAFCYRAAMHGGARLCFVADDFSSRGDCAAQNPAADVVGQQLEGLREGVQACM
jgi:hypothetical protein